jgi:hypothetical protein
MDADLEALRVAVAAQHDRLEAWLSALEGCLAEADVPSDVESDPRFDAAVDDLAEADVQRQLLALEVLGLDLGADDEEDDGPGDGATEEQLPSDVFAVNLVVAVPEHADPARLDDVLDVLDTAADAVIGQLEAAGFLVPELGLSRGLDDGPDDEALDDALDEAIARQLAAQLDAPSDAASPEDEDGPR